MLEAPTAPTNNRKIVLRVRDEFLTARAPRRHILRVSDGDNFAQTGELNDSHPAAAANISANARAHVLRVLGASVASERRVVMAVLRGYRQALACAQPA